MRQEHITRPATEMNYPMAAQLAAAFVEKDAELIEPVLVAWYDRKDSKMSPVIEGADQRASWHDYGASHGGKLEIEVGDDYAFIYGDSSAFDPYDHKDCPYANLHDAQGDEFLCQIGLLDDPHVPQKKACVALDEWTSKLT
ncbi:MAG: AF1514 family protein [Pseudomonadota bacterium]|jgi:hypothetical protein